MKFSLYCFYLKFVEFSSSQICLSPNSERLGTLFPHIFLSHSDSSHGGIPIIRVRPFCIVTQIVYLLFLFLVLIFILPLLMRKLMQ